MRSWLVKGDLPAKGKEKAATELFELDVNKRQERDQEPRSPRQGGGIGERAQPFFWYIKAAMGKNRQGY
jgi:hypothetical protein